MSFVPGCCQHGVPFTPQMECQDCDAEWIQRVTLPALRSRLARILRFCERYPMAVERSAPELSSAYVELRDAAKKLGDAQ